ncbi:MAG: efflux RND transporter permease subunit [Angelakisella sp.]
MLSRLSVKRPMTIFICVVLALILGVMSFINMTTDLLPSMDLPYVIAYTTYAGASPEQVEQSVTKALESALATTGGVKNITSVSQENVSIVVLEFEEGTGMDSAMIEMSASLDQIAGSLPEGAGSPVLMKLNPDMLPIMVLAVDSDGMQREELSRFTAETVIPALERVDGVASVTGSGLVESQIRVELDQAKIDALNSKVLRAVSSTLADAEQELKKARRELNDGKKKLEEQSDTAYGQLVAAAQQLSDAKQQAALGSTLTSAEVQALQAVLAQYDNMVNLRDRYNASETDARNTLTPVKYAELQSLQTRRALLRSELQAAQTSLEAAEATLQEIGSSEAALRQDVTNAEDALTAAQTAYDEALAGAPGRLQDDPGWQDLQQQEQAKEVEIAALNTEIAALQSELESAPEDQKEQLQNRINEKQAERTAAEAELASIRTAQNAYLTTHDPQTVSAAEKLSAAEQELARAESRLTAWQQADEAKRQANESIASNTAELESNTAAIKALLGDQKGSEWIAAHDEVQDGYGSIAELESAISALEPRIPELKKELETARASQKELDAALSQLDKAQTELETGKLELSEQLILATLQLQQAEQALDSAEEEFRQQRDAAYKQAGLDGILTQSMISQMMMAQNFSMPAGYIQSEEGQTALKVGEKFQSLEELENWVLFRYDVGEVGEIRLTDIAAVRLADNSEELYAKINGNDGVLLTVQKSSIASTSGACDNLYAAMEKLQERYPGLHLTALSDQGQYIDLVISSVLENLLLGALLAVVILLLFLRDFRPTVIVALSIPVSLLLAVVLMYFSGVTLNIISLSGLALGVGMLVDNSIVAIENIYRLRQLGYNAATAAVHGCRQIAGAITASTLTTVCVFAPILFTGGLTRQLFADMGLTIAYSLGASLLVALTLVPALSGKILTGETAAVRPNRLLERMIAGYETLLRRVLRHKLPVLLGAVALLIVSALLAVSMGTAFMPEMDSPQVSVSIEMPQEATTEESRAMCDTVLERILSVEGVSTVGAMESQSLMGGGSSLSIYVLLGEERSESSQQIARRIEEATADLDCTVTANGSTMDMSMMTGGSGIRLAVTGDDMDTLRQTAAGLAECLSGVEGIAAVSDGQEDSSTEVRVTVDKSKAAEYGLTVAQVYQQVAVAIRAETSATTLSVEGNDLPVVVVPDAAGLTTRETLPELMITGTKNNEECEVRLSEIAAIGEGVSPTAINRENQARTITVTAAIAEGSNIGLVSREVEKRLAGYEMPEGYTFALEGENEMISSTMGDLVLMIALAVVLIYLIMTAQFQSLLSPFIVLFTIPLAFTGGLLALWITGKELSVIAMLGFLMLAGVVVNNGIVFVDYVNQLRLEGMDRTEALVRTGRDRIRPILMTAMTTIFGLFTMALGLGSGGDMLQPLAIVTIGGLAYATLLTLFVVPAIYDIFLKKELKKVVIEEVTE